MSKTIYAEDLRRRLSDVAGRMELANRQRRHGTGREKVAAAGELAVLERRHRELEQRLTRLAGEPEGRWEDFKTALENDFDALFSDVRSWITTHERSN